MREKNFIPLTKNAKQIKSYLRSYGIPYRTRKEDGVIEYVRVRDGEYIAPDPETIMRTA